MSRRAHKPKVVYTTVKEPLTPEEQKIANAQWMRIGVGSVLAVAVLGCLFVGITRTHVAAPVEPVTVVQSAPSNARTCKETANMTRDVMEHDGYSTAAANAKADQFLMLCYSTGKK